jgi:predicted NUDIX family NTP pyrophosphohydrolase
MYRRASGGAIEVLLAHPGGPFWKHRDEGAWTLPKGEYAPGEIPLAAARREFVEETGFAASPPFLPLGDVVQKGGKRISVWAFAGDADPAHLRSNCFEIEWPPRSGRKQQFPEIDRAGWFGLVDARAKMNPSQAELLARLEAALEARAD